MFFKSVRYEQAKREQKFPACPGQVLACPGQGLSSNQTQIIRKENSISVPNSKFPLLEVEKKSLFIISVVSVVSFQP